MKRPPKDFALLTILAGPAGSGKTTLCERMVTERPGVERVVTCTTRAPREGEIDGRHYHFLSEKEFDRYVAEGAFLEWARVHTNRYGSLKRSICDKLEGAVDLVMNVDVQGVANFRDAASADATIGRRLVTVFILPADQNTIRRRLLGRGQDDEAEIQRRLATAEGEVGLWTSFDYVIDSRTKDEDFDTLLHIWLAEKRRVSRLVD